MGALIGIGALINKNTFKGGAYWKEGANRIITVIPIIQDFKIKTSSHGLQQLMSINHLRDK